MTGASTHSDKPPLPPPITCSAHTTARAIFTNGNLLPLCWVHEPRTCPALSMAEMHPAALRAGPPWPSLPLQLLLPTKCHYSVPLDILPLLQDQAPSHLWPFICTSHILDLDCWPPALSHQGQFMLQISAHLSPLSGKPSVTFHSSSDASVLCSQKARLLPLHRTSPIEAIIWLTFLPPRSAPKPIRVLSKGILLLLTYHFPSGLHSILNAVGAAINMGATNGLDLSINNSIGLI